MKTTVNKYDFERAFMAIRPDNFSRAGLDAMFDYLNQYEDETDTEIELDVIAICCDFSEYASFEEAKGDYLNVETMEDLFDSTTVIEVGEHGLIIAAF